MRSTRLYIAASVAAACVVGMLAVQSTQAQTYKVLRSFGGPKGGFPGAGVIRDTEGNLYGTTYRGGTSNQGVVFKLSPTGKETVLHNFTGGADGGSPVGGVIRDASGNLYGTTGFGGDLNCPYGNGPGCGTVFKLDPTGKETVLYSFKGRTDGSLPHAGVIQDAKGNLYGTTSGNFGKDGFGTVFKVSQAGKESVLYRFAAGTDGREPLAGLIRDAQGNLYGTTAAGGTSGCDVGCGTVFKLSPTGKETVLYRFTGGTDGSSPDAGVIQDAQGNLYGTTADGGGSSSCEVGCGTVFKLDPTGKETLLHIFTAGTDGAGPGGVIQDAAGNLYGTTSTGGGDGNNGNGCGIAFKLDPTGKETLLHVFAGKPDGCFAVEPLFQDAKGNFYGTTITGGVDDFGTVFELTP
jgi:uncharacterized repeat protein (TIGR03803 family)